ncbi:MAG TPA: TonB-dependent receptor [Thermoanaerobaculia bacterium]|nr:TonB-dependent receptor [Thermoanaerobaculia bacterium]
MKRAAGGLLTGSLLALAAVSGSAGAAARDVAPPWAAEPPAPEAGFYGTATVRERPLESATAAVTVLDREAIEALGAETVGDLLRFVPGVVVTGSGGRGGLATAMVRGGDPNFTRVLVDGVPVNDGTYPVGEVFDLGALPASAVERIEVVRGPLSAYYGSTGLAGAVHVITRRGEPGPVRLAAAAEAGDASFRAVEGALSGGGARGDGFLHVAHQQEAERVAAERFALDQLQGRARRALGERASLEVAGRLAVWDADEYPEASGGPRLGSGELRRSEHREGSVGVELEVAERGSRPARPSHRLTLALYRHELERESPAIGFLVPRSDEATELTRTRLGWAWTAIARETLQVSVGADLEREEGTNDGTLFLSPGPQGAVSGDYSLARTTPGAYTEVIARRGGLVVELGARLDLPDDAGLEWSPRLGASWRPGGGATRLRASAGRAFKLPSFFALASPPALGGNPDLDPEVMVGADLGAERRFEAAGLEAGVGVFLNRYRDLVDFDFETFSHVNRSEVEARGVEASVAWRPEGPLSFALDLTRQEVEDRSSGEPLRHRPDWAGALRLAWRPRPGLALRLDGAALSGYRDEQLPVPDRRTVDGRAVWGAGASWRVTGPWSLRARIDNLTDAEYETLIGFPGPGRSVRLGLRYAPTR